MSKHTKEGNKVEDLLRTLANSDDLTVSTIETPFVNFTAQEGVVQKLQSLIWAPLEFASTLWRAVKSLKPKSEESKYDSDQEYEEAISSSLKSKSEEQQHDSDQEYEEAISRNVDEVSQVGNIPSSSELLHNIITPECIEGLGLQAFEQTDYSIVSSTTQSKSGIVAKRIESGANLIGFALNHPEYIKKILDKKVGPISQEDDFTLLEDTDLSPDQNIFCVVRADKTVTAKFNTARFIQVMQQKGYYSLSESSPIIAKLMSSANTYSINLDHLQLYIGSKIAPMIFQPTMDHNKLMLKPIGVYNAVSDSQETDEILVGTKPLFNIAVDVSGSMASELNLCKEKLAIILKQIVSTNEDWTIIITKFNSNHLSKVFESTGNKVEDLVKLGAYIKDFIADGNTNLLGTMHDQFSALSSSKYSSYASIVFTDGEDNCKIFTEEQVIDIACKTKEQLNNFQIFTLELGGKNLNFFTNLASEAGCTHIKLDSISDLSQFEQYTKSLSLSSKVVQFLLDSQKLYQMTIVGGQVEIGSQLIPTNTKVIIDGEPYSIQWPTKSFDTFERSIYSEEQVQVGGDNNPLDEDSSE